MYLMGIDPGEQKTAFSLVRKEGERLFVLKVERVDNEAFLGSLPGFLEGYSPLLVVLECPLGQAEVRQIARKKGRKERYDKRGYVLLDSQFKRIRALLEEFSVFFLTPKAVERKLEGFTPPGWRQAVTGLLRPSEGDLLVELSHRYEAGEILGARPKDGHEADALGMVLWAVKKGFAPVG